MKMFSKIIFMAISICSCTLVASDVPEQAEQAIPAQRVVIVVPRDAMVIQRQQQPRRALRDKLCSCNFVQYMFPLVLTSALACTSAAALRWRADLLTQEQQDLNVGLVMIAQAVQLTLATLYYVTHNR